MPLKESLVRNFSPFPPVGGNVPMAVVGVRPFLHLLMPSRRITRIIVTSFQVSPPRGVWGLLRDPPAPLRAPGCSKR